jgi:hypothetical protein
MQGSRINQDLPRSTEWSGFNVACVWRFSHRVQHSINQTRSPRNEGMTMSATQFDTLVAMHFENERQSSGGTRKRLYPKQESKTSAPLQRLVRFCVSLRFCSSAILPLDHSWVKRTAGVRLRRRDSHGKRIVITIRDQHSKMNSR